MEQYRYTLDKSSKKFVCPTCNRKSFVKYFNHETESYLIDDYGRCDRETNCGYHKAPSKGSKYFNNNLVNAIITRETPSKVTPSFHPIELLDKMYVENSQIDNLTEYLKSKFSNEEVFYAMQNYFITGTNCTWNNSTAFWQIDEHQKIHACKIMLYDRSTGKRIKKPYNHINWLHKAITVIDFNLCQCLFGLHRITEDFEKTIAIVESEKTAIVMSIFLPDYIWIATGSKQNLKLDLFRPIEKRNIVLFPDKGEYSNWQKKATELNKIGFKIAVSELIEQTNYENGFDLADYYFSL